MPTTRSVAKCRTSTNNVQMSNADSRSSSIPEMFASTSSECHFLDKLPPELRLMIYEYFLVSNEPLRGRTARRDRRYGLETAILALNRQICQEASSVFFGKNTFYITSIPEHSSTGEDTQEKKEQSHADPKESLSEASVGRFDPPIQPQNWPLLRHLTIDLLCYTPNPISLSAWRPVSPHCSSYIQTFTDLIRVTSPALKSLSLTSELQESFCARKALTSFFILDRNAPFAAVLASLYPGIKSLPLSFEFPDCYFRIEVEPAVFTRRSILLLACQVLFCQSQMRIDEMLKAFETGQLGREERTGNQQGEKHEKRIDLAPYVGHEWSRKLKRSTQERLEMVFGEVT